MQRPARDPREPGEGSPPAARELDPAAQGLEAETVELTAAAAALGVSAQGLWALIEQHGLTILRRRLAGRSLSALTRVDFEHLEASAARARAGRTPVLGARNVDPLDPLVTKVRDAESRADGLEKRALELRSRLVETGLRAGAAQQQMSDLRERFEAELEAARRDQASAGAELDAVRQECQELSRTLERERREYDRAVSALRAERASLRRQLDLARQVEVGTDAYINRLEVRYGLKRGARSLSLGRRRRRRRPGPLGGPGRNRSGAASQEPRRSA